MLDWTALSPAIHRRLPFAETATAWGMLSDNPPGFEPAGLAAATSNQVCPKSLVA